MIRPGTFETWPAMGGRSPTSWFLLTTETNKFVLLVGCLMHRSSQSKLVMQAYPCIHTYIYTHIYVEPVRRPAYLAGANQRVCICFLIAQVWLVLCPTNQESESRRREVDAFFLPSLFMYIYICMKKGGKEERSTLESVYCVVSTASPQRRQKKGGI